MRGRCSTTDDIDAVQTGFALHESDAEIAARLPGRSVQAIRKLRLSIGLPRPHFGPSDRARILSAETRRLRRRLQEVASG